MAHTRFEQSMTVAAPVERVRAALATLTAHDRLHPLIVSVEALPDGVAVDGSALSRYRIVDRVRMGPLTLTSPIARRSRWMRLARSSRTPTSPPVFICTSSRS